VFALPDGGWSYVSNCESVTVGGAGFVRWGDLSAGSLQVLTEVGGVLAWAVVPDPDGSPVATRYQVTGTKPFNGGEGAVMSRGRLVFTTKGDGRVWLYDPRANTLSVVYDYNRPIDGELSGVDNVTTSGYGAIYVAEDGGNMQIVLVCETGQTYPVVELPGVTGSEITGLPSIPRARASTSARSGTPEPPTRSRDRGGSSTCRRRPPGGVVGGL
jgi:hypothetical protein